ncbi:hypothetical protein J6590_060687 [Homalodisca vitripennis]|nr:hypothetical protein J6590_060687 [Homalodisca vitripennis]
MGVSSSFFIRKKRSGEETETNSSTKQCWWLFYKQEEAGAEFNISNNNTGAIGMSSSLFIHKKRCGERERDKQLGQAVGGCFINTKRQAQSLIFPTIIQEQLVCLLYFFLRCGHGLACTTVFLVNIYHASSYIQIRAVDLNIGSGNLAAVSTIDLADTDKTQLMLRLRLRMVMFRLAQHLSHLHQIPCCDTRGGRNTYARITAIPEQSIGGVPQVLKAAVSLQDVLLLSYVSRETGAKFVFHLLDDTTELPMHVMSTIHPHGSRQEAAPIPNLPILNVLSLRKEALGLYEQLGDTDIYYSEERKSLSNKDSHPTLTVIRDDSQYRPRRLESHRQSRELRGPRNQIGDE